MSHCKVSHKHVNPRVQLSYIVQYLIACLLFYLFLPQAADPSGPERRFGQSEEPGRNRGGEQTAEAALPGTNPRQIYLFFVGFIKNDARASCPGRAPVYVIKSLQCKIFHIATLSWKVNKRIDAFIILHNVQGLLICTGGDE